MKIDKNGGEPNHILKECFMSAMEAAINGKALPSISLKLFQQMKNAEEMAQMTQYMRKWSEESELNQNRWIGMGNLLLDNIKK